MDEVFLGKDYNTVRNYSEEIAKDIDEEIKKIVSFGYKRCEELLTIHMDKLHVLANYLIENEKIDGECFLKLMNDEIINADNEYSVSDETNTDATEE